MKIKIKEPILDYEGKEIKQPPEDKTLTFFDVFINSLNSQMNGEPPLPAETKNKIYQISKKIYASDEPNFTPDQLLLIKERVGKAYAPMVYGKVCEIIDGVDDQPADPPAA